MRLFDLAEPAAAILGRKSPPVRRGANEPALRLFAAFEIDPVHYDEFVNDAADLARHFGALHLDLESERAIEFVEHLFEDADENNMLCPRMLKLVQPEHHLARVQPISAA